MRRGACPAYARTTAHSSARVLASDPSTPTTIGRRAAETIPADGATCCTRPLRLSRLHTGEVLGSFMTGTISVAVGWSRDFSAGASFAADFTVPGGSADRAREGPGEGTGRCPALGDECCRPVAPRRLSRRHLTLTRSVRSQRESLVTPTGDHYGRERRSADG